MEIIFVSFLLGFLIPFAFNFLFKNKNFGLRNSKPKATVPPPPPAPAPAPVPTPPPFPAPKPNPAPKRKFTSEFALELSLIEIQNVENYFQKIFCRTKDFYENIKNSDPYALYLQSIREENEKFYQSFEDDDNIFEDDNLFEDDDIFENESLYKLSNEHYSNVSTMLAMIEASNEPGSGMFDDMQVTPKLAYKIFKTIDKCFENNVTREFFYKKLEKFQNLFLSFLKKETFDEISFYVDAAEYFSVVDHYCDTMTFEEYEKIVPQIDKKYVAKVIVYYNNNKIEMYKIT